jgi:predicted CopG family antitoxin
MGRRPPDDWMVKVITIMDDVYSDLYKLKAAKDMSFSELFRYMLSQMGEERENIISFAGTVNEADIDRRAMEKMRRDSWRAR